MRPAHRDYKRTEPHAEEWLLIEWPKKESEPAKYWLSTLPAGTSLKSLVNMARHRWIIERDYEELKQELDWAIMKDEAGGAFSTTPRCASPRMDSRSAS
jgi:SRSO17 transposase